MATIVYGEVCLTLPGFEWSDDMGQLTEPRFRRDEYDAAGDVLASDALTMSPAWDDAIAKIDDWRTSHAYPLLAFRINLENWAATIDPEAIIAQRLKRLSSVKAKLRALKTRDVKLTQIQDIGGCRAIVRDVAAVRELTKLYREREKRTKHIFGWEDDYVTDPKRATGYRSHHLIYEFGSDAENKQCFRGHRIEIQVRSQLQHGWATAVETVDYFTGQRLKSNVGQAPWKRFFKLTSGAFALREGTPSVPGTPTDRAALIAELAKAEQAVRARETLEGFKVAANFMGRTRRKDAALFLLELDTAQRALSVTPYTRAQQQEAASRRLELEKQFLGNDSVQIVVVEVTNLKDLERAYPNYYSDLGIFLAELDEALNEK